MQISVTICQCWCHATSVPGSFDVAKPPLHWSPSHSLAAAASAAGAPRVASCGSCCSYCSYCLSSEVRLLSSGGDVGSTAAQCCLLVHQDCYHVGPIQVALCRRSSRPATSCSERVLLVVVVVVVVVAVVVVVVVVVVFLSL